MGNDIPLYVGGVEELPLPPAPLVLVDAGAAVVVVVEEGLDGDDDDDEEELAARRWLDRYPRLYSPRSPLLPWISRAAKSSFMCGPSSLSVLF